MLAARTRRVLGAVALLLAVPIAGCDLQPTAPAGDGAAPFAVARLPGPAELTGTVGPGSTYKMYVPEDWNGELVIFIHGYCGFPPNQNSPTDCLPGPSSPLVTAFLGAGYAFAAASFSDIGMVIRDGAIRSAQLKALFTSKFGRPARTYLVSQSMGGAIAMKLAETRGAQFDGVMPVCGIVGGLTYQLDFYSNVRTLFNYYFPGILPAEPIPTPTFNTAVAPLVMNAVVLHSAEAMDLAGVDQVELPYRDVGELTWAIVYPLMFITSDRFYGDLLGRTHDHEFFDNSDTWYAGSLDDATLNEGITRFTAHPDARNMLKQWYEPTGKLSMPVLTLHNTGDPIVPGHHEARYAALAAAAGSSDLLLQRFTPVYGANAHCAFSAAEMVAGLEDLAQWVKTGTKPAS